VRTAGWGQRPQGALAKKIKKIVCAKLRLTVDGI